MLSRSLWGALAVVCATACGGGDSSSNPEAADAAASSGSSGGSGKSGATGRSGASGVASGSGGSAGRTGASGSTAGSASTGSQSGSSGSAIGPLGCADGGPPPDVTPGKVLLAIDLSKGPARQFHRPAGPAPVSPYVYGINAFAASQSTTKWGLLRWGGNLFTPWNWTNNFSNSGSDWCFAQNNEGGGATLAGSIAGPTFPSVPTALGKGIAALVTVPILDFVASSAVTNNLWSGSTPPCPGTPACTTGAHPNSVNAANFPFASTDPTSNAYVKNSSTKGSPLCTCAGSGCQPCSVDVTGPVFQDEFVNYLKTMFGAGGAPIFFSMDNEPNYWPSTHPELWPYTGTPGCTTKGTVPTADLIARNTTYATMVKAVWPDAKVFGPVVDSDGMFYGGDYDDPNWATTTFADEYLSSMADASAAAGHALLDVLDVHYYTDGTSAKCVQGTQLFWDPNFTQLSASDTDGFDFFWSGLNDDFDKKYYPRQMIPRLLGMIDEDYSGKGTPAPALSFSEYNAGCESTVEGGVAQADLLGIFGREGVFSATAWPVVSPIVDANGKLTDFLVAAFDVYRNYDGQGSVVGDIAVYAQASDVASASVYAFRHSGDPSKVDVVAINRTGTDLAVTFQMTSAPVLDSVSRYQLTTATVGVVPAPGPAPQPVCRGDAYAFDYTLPALSATTLVFN